MKRIFVFLTAAAIFFNNPTAIAENRHLDEIISKTSEYICETVASPSIGSIGGEWSVIGLARSGLPVDSGYFEKYLKNAEAEITEKNGVLHERKYTEYSRVILAFTSLGKNPENVGGFNLLKPLADYKQTVWQGINGAVFALLALDSGDYLIPPAPQADIQATREMYIDGILKMQNSDGGFAIDSSSDISESDMTAMVLQALAKYTDREDVKTAVERATVFLSEKQTSDGGYENCGEENAESVSQVITALCELGISLDDPRFIKNGYTLTDNLLLYMCGNGGFKHKLTDKEPDLMATEQAFCALTAADRINKGKTSLYRMTDNRADLKSTVVMGLNAAKKIFALYGVNTNEKK